MRPAYRRHRTRVIGSMIAITITAASLTACASSGGAAAAPNGPALKSTQLVATALADLKTLHEPATVLGNFSAQLNIPQSWITKAKAEGKVTIETDEHPNQTNAIKQAFEERYPYIDATFVYGSTESTRAQTLATFKDGKNVADVIGGITQSIGEFEQAGALEKVNDLPVWQSIPTNSKDSNDFWVGYATKFWGFGYNTSEVKVSQLPKTWQSLATDARLNQGGFGISDRPELFVYQLAGTYGTQFAENFSKQLFALKPEQRSEGQGALPELIANGTVPIVLPSASYEIEQLAVTGAPVGWYTPQPPISNVSDLEIMSNATDPYAAKILVNWLGSSEGELVSSVAQGISPVLPSLSKITALYPYASQVLGKTLQYTPPAKQAAISAAINPIWDADWGK